MVKLGYWTIVQILISRSDIIIEVLDARAPELCRIAKLEGLVRKHKKRLIKVVNKSDLVSRTSLANLKKQYSQTDEFVLSVKNKKDMDLLLENLRPKKYSFYRTRVAIIGYPNTGKSSLVNQLSKGGKTKTSSVSGFTKGKQKIAGKENLLLFDSPGVVPYGARDEIRLGIIAGISPSKLKDPDLVVYEMLKIVHKRNPQLLRQKYGLNYINPTDFVVKYALKKKMLLKKRRP